MDQIIQRMERYADNLEDVVSERTQQLVLEQRKTDELLGRMLPKLNPYYVMLYMLCYVML